MEKKKKLLINTDPAVRTYTFHGFFHAITAAKDKVDTLAAEISVEKFEDYVWNQQTDRLECCYDGQDGRIRFLSNQWNIGMNHCFWRKCDKEDRIEIEIHKQLFSGSRGAINLFIADGSFQDMTDEEHYLFRFGNHCRDGFYVNCKGAETGVADNEDEDRHLILEIKEGVCRAILSGQSGERVMYTEKIEDTCDPVIGFEIRLNNNEYYEWMYSNYIEVCVVPGRYEQMIDYLFNSVKNWIPYQSNHFLDYWFYPKKMIDGYPDNRAVLDFVKKCLNKGIYVEMLLEEQFLFGEDSEPFVHHDMIYGYDDERRELNVFNLTLGRPLELTMRYEDFLTDRNLKTRLQEIILVMYHPDDIPYRLDCRYLADMTRKFLDSTDVNMGLRHSLMNIPEAIWGIAALEYLATEEGSEALIKDIRISHLLYERSVCMMNRIEYLTERKILSKEEKDALCPMVERANKLTYMIRTFALIAEEKRKKNAEYKMAANVKKAVKDLIQIEREYMTLFHKILLSKGE
ncbi:MAG: hypothetical protein J6Z35_09965 [Lachnospiraceae bacterium]|nr:hypothetical protein [Lachnospiraceae bacterium]